MSAVLSLVAVLGVPDEFFEGAAHFIDLAADVDDVEGHEDRGEHEHDECENDGDAGEILQGVHVSEVSGFRFQVSGVVVIGFVGGGGFGDAGGGGGVIEDLLDEMHEPVGDAAAVGGRGGGDGVLQLLGEADGKERVFRSPFAAGKLSWVMCFFHT